MTTLANRPATALLVIDSQRSVLAKAHRRDAVVANIAIAVDTARRAGVPVIWVQQTDDERVHGSDAWQIVDELTPSDGESRVVKAYPDAFDDTALAAVLADLGVGRLFLAGAETDECIRATLHGAIVRGYDTTLISDAHTTNDNTEWGAPPPETVIAHTNLYWAYHTAPGRTAGTVTTSELAF